LLEPLVVSTQRDGSFLFPKVVPGKYTLSASKGISPEVSIIVGNSDLQNVVIPSARLKDIPGRITIDGTGTPLPVTATFSISWTVAGSFPSAGSGSLVSPSVTIARVATVRSDGSFTVSLPEGESHITASPEMLAPGYRLQELRYGSRSVQGGPLSIKTEDSAHLEVRIGVDPGFPRITGRIVSARASMSERMMIYGPTVKAALQIEVKPDGTFQAPRLTTGTLLVRFFSSSPVPLPEIFIPAGASGVIEVSLPQIRSTPSHVTVEGGGAPPPFTLRLEGTIAAGLPSGKAAGSIGSPETRLLGLGVDIAPAPDGTFPLTLPDGEYQFGIVIAKPSSNRYALKSFRSRGVDLTKNPLKVGSTEDATIEVVFRKGR
jgi:hypothetical protein